MWYGTSSVSFLVTGSSKRRPIRRFTAKTVFSGLVTAWRLAGWPTSRSPSLVKATIEGVVRAPSAFSTTLGLPASMTATQLLVVPRSIPMTLAMLILLCPKYLVAPLGARGGTPECFVVDIGGGFEPQKDAPPPLEAPVDAKTQHPRRRGGARLAARRLRRAQAG